MKTTLRTPLTLLLCAALCLCLIPAASADSESLPFPDSSPVGVEIAFPEPAISDLESLDAVNSADTAELIEAETFYGPGAPTAGSFVIPTGTTSIGSEAFADCVGMVSVSIPASVTSISADAFSGCVNLTDVYFGGTPAQWDSLIANHDDGPLLNAVLHISGDRWIPIRSPFFPDPAFREYILINKDTDRNGYLSRSEIAAVTTIDCRGPETSRGAIRSLKGIDLFYNLTGLDCRNNQVTDLDVRWNSKLELLYCSDNPLTGLDLSGNPLLRRLYCSNTGLTALDLSHNPALETVYAHYNNLTVLDVSSNTNLIELFIAYNALTQLRLPNSVRRLEVLGNKLTSLDLRYNTVLEALYCGRNMLRSLLVTSTRLLTLDCHVNDLTSLDISKTTALAQLDCSYNQLSSLDISRCSKLVQVTRTVAKRVSNGIVYYYVDSNSSYLIYDDPDGGYTGGIPITEEYFPDPTFRTGVAKNYDKNHDGFLSYREIRPVKSIYCSGLGIRTLKGIEYFTSLTTLRCYNNPLTELNISTLTDLRILECYGTRISVLDIRNNVYLRGLIYNTVPYVQSGVVTYSYSDTYLLRYNYGVRLYY